MSIDDSTLDLFRGIAFSYWDDLDWGDVARHVIELQDALRDEQRAREQAEAELTELRTVEDAKRDYERGWDAAVTEFKPRADTAEASLSDLDAIPPEFKADAERIWANLQWRGSGTRYVVKVEVEGLHLPSYSRTGVLAEADAE